MFICGHSCLKDEEKFVRRRKSASTLSNRGGRPSDYHLPAGGEKRKPGSARRKEIKRLRELSSKGPAWGKLWSLEEGSRNYLSS